MEQGNMNNGPPERAKPTRPRGTGTLYQRGHTWWIGYSVRGRTFNESSHSRKKGVAELLLKRRLGEIGSGTFLPPQTENLLVEELAPDLFADYEANGRRTAHDVKRVWEMHLEPFFRGRRAVDVHGDLITRYVVQRQAEKAKPATINRELAALGRMFALARKNGKVRDIPPIQKLREHNARKGFLPDGVHLKIVEACPQLWFRTVVEVGRCLGWRISEILGLKVKQIDLFRRLIRLEVGTTKNREGREVPLTDALFVLLSECIHGKGPEDAVITRPSGKPVKDIRKAWYRGCVHAGLAKLHCPQCMEVVDEALHCAACGRTWQLNQLRYRGLLFHDLRRTAARNLRNAGVAEEVVMRIGGWLTSSVFKRYSIVNADDMKAALAKLQQREQLIEAARRDQLQLHYSCPEIGAVAGKAPIN